MRVRVFDIYQVPMELRPLKADVFQVVAAGQEVCEVQYMRQPDRRFWRCPCGRYEVSGKVEALLIHVVTNHANVTYREPWRASSPSHAEPLRDAQSIEQRLTYLRLAGQHPDPTAHAAIRTTP